MDVDGTLTDSKIYMSAEGELLKAFNIKDGYAIAHLSEKDIIPVIIKPFLTCFLSLRFFRFLLLLLIIPHLTQNLLEMYP